MVERNPDIAELQDDYLFVEIMNRKEKLLEAEPQAKIINLGIGNTTEPIPDLIVESFIKKARRLGTIEGYSGYDNPFGSFVLREEIAKKIYKGRALAEDVFISDGAKCDLGRLQLLFGRKTAAMIQDPAYPVYAASSVMAGKKDIVYMPCRPDNGFFPDLKTLPYTHLIYICSPNNPTGAVLTHEQLKELVNIAQQRGSFIIFDSAYAGFIRDPTLPRSIYEVEGAENVAIEIGSFSKLVGFTGVRLGWAVVPKQLRFKDGSSLQKDWIKIISTFFNGASNLAQAGGLASLTDEGLAHSQKLCDYYLENSKILKSAAQSKGYRCFGGDNAPYLWVDIKGQSSWKVFDDLLHRAHLLTTPGVGFGPTGEGFLRLSAFGKRESIIEAANRLKKALY